MTIQSHNPEAAVLYLAHSADLAELVQMDTPITSSQADGRHLTSQTPEAATSNLPWSAGLTETVQMTTETNPVAAVHNLAQSADLAEPVQMDTPITSSQVPDAVSLVAQRKAHYLDKRAKVKGGEEVQVSCPGFGVQGSGFRV